MNYPTIEQVEAAQLSQLAWGWRFLRSPENAAEREALTRLIKRFDALGGWTPELSKQVGWEQPLPR